MSSRCYTKFQKSVISVDGATTLYNYLSENIEWEESIRSKNGHTRLGKMLSLGEIDMVDLAIIKALTSITKTNYIVLGIYLNFYRDGNEYCPSHSHPGTHQLVISLGSDRKFIANKKEYLMQNGDAILFGSATHSVPKQAACGGRISIATFMKPYDDITQ